MADTISFSQLSAVLAQLGFQEAQAEDFTAFRNDQSDALLFLPREEAMPEVDSLHVAAARATVAGKGIASPDEFDRLLAQVARPQDEQPFSTNSRLTLAKPRSGNAMPFGHGYAGRPKKTKRLERRSSAQPQSQLST